MMPLFGGTPRIMYKTTDSPPRLSTAMAVHRIDELKEGAKVHPRPENRAKGIW